MLFFCLFVNSVRFIFLFNQNENNFHKIKNSGLILRVLNKEELGNGIQVLAEKLDHL
jgi:hypothetical protein